MRAPDFWRAGGGSMWPTLLSPLSLVFDAAGKMRQRGVMPWKAPVPVICVGNLTVGGTGKTPTVLAIADRLQAADLKVATLSRGYGGREHGPLAVDLKHHTAEDVGDEPLLLARTASAWIARDRREGCREAILAGADVVILDDGLQNPALRYDLRFVVVDAGYGFGNRRLLPAGPLREPITRGLARASAIVLIGDGPDALASELARAAPVLRARLVPDDAALRLKGRRVLAFAGIGRPEKFFATLTELGAEIIERHQFADHHRYTPDEAMRLVEAAQRLEALPVSTAKDFVRLPAGSQAMVTAVGVSLRFDDASQLDRLLEPVLHGR